MIVSARGEVARPRVKPARTIVVRNRIVQLRTRMMMRELSLVGRKHKAALHITDSRGVVVSRNLVDRPRTGTTGALVDTSSGMMITSTTARTTALNTVRFLGNNSLELLNLGITLLPLLSHLAKKLVVLPFEGSLERIFLWIHDGPMLRTD
jgi:hypothetical protein